MALVDEDPLDKKFQKELQSGITALVLLSVLNRAKQPMYGYQIAKQIGAEHEDAALKQGVFYPVLRSLESSALLSSMVEPSVSGPPRRYYSITDAGRAALSRWSAIWRDTQTFIDSLLEEDSHDQ
jgi:PadR family transcriptional regulator, regulatory protein PadR